MSGSNSDKSASWRGLFGGCLVLILLFGGIFYVFHYFSQKKAAEIQVLQTTLFTPYQVAIQSSDFEGAVSFRSSEWLKNNDHESLAAAYRKATDEHGALKSILIHSANGFTEPGMEGQAMKVKTHFLFADGWRGQVSYNIVRATPNDDWKLDRSFTPMSSSLGEGPY